MHHTKTYNPVYKNLLSVIRNAHEIEPNKDKKMVIFSDLHLGDGGRKDDFNKNANLFTTVLEQLYYHKGYTLILNGDIEELQKFSLAGIRKRWSSVYRLFNLFNKEKRFYRTVGNHDETLYHYSKKIYSYELYDCLKVTDRGNTIFIYHGHQSSLFFTRYNAISGFFLRYLAKPFFIKNLSVSYSNRKKFITERRVYRFSSRHRIISIIGHTHRPLFESLSKIDSIRFAIEQLCRSYPAMDTAEKGKTEDKIKQYKAEMHRYFNEKKNQSLITSLYSSHILIPSLFNSGCVIGKRGMTCIEIDDGIISLVHWFDKKRSKKYLLDKRYSCENLANTNYFRVALKEEPLSYIFARIKLLT